MSNIYYWEKLAFSKLVGKVNSLEKKFKKLLALKSKKVHGIFGEMFILTLVSSAAVFCLQNHVSDFM